GVPPLDDIEDAARDERVEVLHSGAPAVRAEDGDVGMLGEDVFGEVAAREAGDSGDQDAHWAPTLARAVPLVGRLVCRRRVAGKATSLPNARRFYETLSVTASLRHTLCRPPRTARNQGRRRGAGPDAPD